MILQNKLRKKYWCAMLYCRLLYSLTPHHLDDILSGINQIFILLATGFWGLEAVCRISPTPSQQVGEVFARIFGIGQKSP